MDIARQCMPIAWLRRAPAIIGVPVGFLLIAGGLFSFLPVLGFWMLPLGLWILGPHLPIAERASRRAVRWAARRGWLGAAQGRVRAVHDRSDS
jgi:hypothetical protein